MAPLALPPKMNWSVEYSVEKEYMCLHTCVCSQGAGVESELEREREG